MAPAHDSRRSPPQRRLSRSGAARRLRRARGAARPPRSARREFVPHVLAIVAGHDGGLPEQRPHLSQRLLALEDPQLRSRPLRRGHSKAIRLRPPGIVRVFCDIHSHMSAFILVFAHRYFAVTDDDGQLPHRQRAAGLVHRRGVERGDAAASRAARRFLTAAARSSSRSSSRSDEDPLVADQPHLPWQRCARGPDHRASRSTASTSRSRRRRRTSCGAGSRRPARCSRRTAPRCSATSRARPASSRTCRTSRRRWTRGTPLTVEPIAAEYQRKIGSDLLVVTDPTGRVLAQAGRLRMPDVPAAHDAVVGATKGHEVVSLWPHPGGIIQVVSVPSLIVNKENNEIEVVGTLSVGFSLDEQSAQQFKALTNSEMAFVVGRHGPGVDAAEGGVRHAGRPRRDSKASAAWTIGDSDYVAVSRTLALNADRRGRHRRDASAFPTAIILRSRTDRLRFLTRFTAKSARHGDPRRPRRDPRQLRHRAHRHAAARHDHRDDARDGGDRRPDAAHPARRRAAMGRRGRPPAGDHLQHHDRLDRPLPARGGPARAALVARPAVDRRRPRDPQPAR